jgi:RimJ/RimL family protein N-acetyltransferase
MSPAGESGVAFALQPTLRGERIELRPLALDDFDALHAAASDPLIWEQHPEPDRHKRDVFQRYFDGGMASRGALTIVERRSGKIIGSSRYCNLKTDDREVEIGWTFLGRAYWGGSYNREVKSLMLAHAFRYVDRVVFVVGENNLRSQKALQKIGARFLRRVQRPGPEGATEHNVVFVITASGDPPRVSTLASAGRGE